MMMEPGKVIEVGGRSEGMALINEERLRKIQ
jgi:hypothetical protein